MNISYLFSSPAGDILLGPEKLITPFKINPSENHPFLTLGDYFDAIKAFILRDHGKCLTSLLHAAFGETVSLNPTDKILIRSEKHGILYHLASAEIFIGKQPFKWAISTAVSEEGKRWLNREYDLLKYLNNTFKLSYLPKVYLKGEMECSTKKGKASLSMFMAQWLEDYHEWHLSLDKEDKRQRICIWDLKNGYRFASKKEGYEIYRQASKILTLYYDTKNHRQIHPWHHAAGDFVAQSKNGGMNVKLTTARRYDPIMASLQEEEINPFVVIIYFFLNMTIRMRLDKINGLGKTAWAEDFSIEATTQGFFEALKIMETEGRYELGKVEDLHSLLKLFDEKELYKLLQSALDFYGSEDPHDLSVIKENLANHNKQLYQIIQRFRL